MRVIRMRDSSGQPCFSRREKRCLSSPPQSTEADSTENVEVPLLAQDRLRLAGSPQVLAAGEVCGTLMAPRNGKTRLLGPLASGGPPWSPDEQATQALRPRLRSQDRPLATSSSNPSRRMAFWRKTNFCTLPLAVKG